MQHGADRVDYILNVIEEAVEASDIDLIVFDNILAWLGDKASDNDTTTRLFEVPRHDRAPQRQRTTRGRVAACTLDQGSAKEAPE